MNEKRKYYLYLAMYDNSRSLAHGQIHWGILMGPKDEDPTSVKKTHGLFHAVHEAGKWNFERRTFECVRSKSMIGRILLGKTEESRMQAVDDVLADARRMVADSPRWDCWSWVEGALKALQETDLVQWKFRGDINLQHLQAYGLQFSKEIREKGLDTGYGIPATVDYPGGGARTVRIFDFFRYTTC